MYRRKDKFDHTHGQTSQGHPVCCAASAKVIELTKTQLTIIAPSQTNRVNYLGELLWKELSGRLRAKGVVYQNARPSSTRSSAIRDIYRRGLFLGIRFFEDSSDPDWAPSIKAFNIAREEYNIYLDHGAKCLIVAPPYDATDEQIKEMAHRTADALGKAAEG